MRQTSSISYLAISVKRNVTHRQRIIPNQNRNRTTVSHNVKQQPKMLKAVIIIEQG